MAAPANYPSLPVRVCQPFNAWVSQECSSGKENRKNLQLTISQHKAPGQTEFTYEVYCREEPIVTAPRSSTFQSTASLVNNTAFFILCISQLSGEGIRSPHYTLVFPWATASKIWVVSEKTLLPNLHSCAPLTAQQALAGLRAIPNEIAGAQVVLALQELPSNQPTPLQDARKRLNRTYYSFFPQVGLIDSNALELPKDTTPAQLFIQLFQELQRASDPTEDSKKG